MSRLIGAPAAMLPANEKNGWNALEAERSNRTGVSVAWAMGVGTSVATGVASAVGSAATVGTMGGAVGTATGTCVGSSTTAVG